MTRPTRHFLQCGGPFALPPGITEQLEKCGWRPARKVGHRNRVMGAETAGGGVRSDEGVREVTGEINEKRRQAEEAREYIR
jgi:hypothetical protein